MARLKGTPIVQSRMKQMPLAVKSKAPTLKSVNNGRNLNDAQMDALNSFLKDSAYEDVFSAGYQLTS